MRNTLMCIALVIAGCSSAPPVRIGGDTYYSSKSNAGGIFGNPSAIAGDLMVDGNSFCEAQGKEFELVTQEVNQPIPATRLGGANITFRCVQRSSSPFMRKDNGVTTIN